MWIAAASSTSVTNRSWQPRTADWPTSTFTSAVGKWRSAPSCIELAPKQVTLDNRDCIFKPHCLAIWYSRQEFYIVNSDPIAQNVAFSPLGDTPANIILPVGKDATYRFGRATDYRRCRSHCNYHPWEIAYVLPRDNPYVAISAADGTFRISKLPVGELDFQVWQERSGQPGYAAMDQGPFQNDHRIGNQRPGDDPDRPRQAGEEIAMTWLIPWRLVKAGKGI